MFEVQFQTQSNAADFLAEIVVADATVTPNVPYDLTNTEVRFGLALCSSCDDYGWRGGACALEGGSATGEVTIDPDPTTGAFDILIPAARLQCVASGNYRLDILMKRGDEGPVHIIRGQVEIAGSVLTWS